jgi:hypothetical protein
LRDISAKWDWYLVKYTDFPRFNSVWPRLSRPHKITFAEMRTSGVRGLLIYCSDYHCSHWTGSAATDGPMMCACPNWSPSLPVRRAAGAARMCSRIHAASNWRDHWGMLSRLEEEAGRARFPTD